MANSHSKTTVRCHYAPRCAPRIVASLACAAAALLLPGGCPAPNGGGNPDGNGGGGGGGGNTSLQITGPRLLQTSARNGDVAILTFRRDATLTGDIAPAAILNGPATDLGTVVGMAVNAAGQFVAVCAQQDFQRNRETTINIFADATRLNGDQTPVRQVTMTGINAFLLDGAALDRSRDILYVFHERLVNNIPTDFVAVFEGTARADFDGTRAPDREFRCANYFGGASFFVDEAADAVHVGAFDSGAIVVFEGASSRSGEAQTCDRSYSLGGGGVAGFALLANGQVFGVTRNSNVGTVVGRSAADSSATTFVSLEIDGSLFANGFAIDTAGTAYVGDSSPARIQIFDNVPTRTSGKFAPDRVVTGPTAGVGGTNAEGAGLLLVLD